MKAACVVLSAVLGLASPAFSAAVYSFVDHGSNVTGRLSGSLNLENAFTLDTPPLEGIDPFISPAAAGLMSGATAATDSFRYFTTNGPLAWGSGSGSFAASSTGSNIGFIGNIPQAATLMLLPTSFTGGPLAGTTRFDGSLATLGITAGSYVYALTDAGGTPTGETLTLNFSAVPLPASLPMLVAAFGLAGSGLAWRRRVRPAL